MALHDLSGSYLPKVQALFYAVFDPQSGPRIVHQVPEGSIATAMSTFPTRISPIDGQRTEAQTFSRAGHRVLFDLSSILDFVIPQPELCDRLVTKATRTSKVLGFPVRILDQSKYNKDVQSYYTRNTFTFNLCFVFDRGAEISAFEPIVRKIARTLTAMETTNSLLSNKESPFRISDLLERLYLDLNVYSESSAPTGLTTLDLVLFPFYANPKEVRLSDVPVAVVNLSEMRHGDWDLTLFKLSSFIDGINHVRRIAELAQVDANLARLCIQHLVYYGAVLLIDLFQYSNRYQLTENFAELHFGHDGTTADQDADLACECERYVQFNGGRSERPFPLVNIFRAYSAITPHRTVSQWIDSVELDEKALDVRRMIQFGVIKGFLRRVRQYPVWLDHPGQRRSDHATKAFQLEQRAHGRLPAQGVEQEPAAAQHYPASLPLLLDGASDTDAICVKYGIGLKQLFGILRQVGGYDDADDAEHMKREEATYGRVVMVLS